MQPHIILKLGETYVSNIIELLEKIGAAPAYGRTPKDAVLQMDCEGLAEDQRQALIGCDVDALNRMLQGRATMFCMIATPDGAEEHELPDRTEDEPDRDNEPQES